MLGVPMNFLRKMGTELLLLKNWLRYVGLFFVNK